MKILGGGADHGRSADVDVLDEFFEVYARFGGSFFEGVEIHYHHVDGLNAMFGHRARCAGIFAAMQNTAMDFRVQRFDTAIEHFGEAGEVGDVFDFDSGVAQELGGSASGDELDAEIGELTGEIGKAGFVGYAEDGALDFGGDIRTSVRKFIGERRPENSISNRG